MEQATLRASARRLREARRRGMVPVSRDLLALAALTGVAVVLMVAWPEMTGRLRDDLRGWMVLAPSAGVRPWEALSAALVTMALVLGPVLAAAFTCAVVAGLIQTRAMLSLEPLKPRLGRIGPAGQTAGDRLYGVCTSLVKVLGAGSLAAWTLWQHGEAVLGTVGAPLAEVLLETLACLMDMALKVGALLLAMALLDVIYQRWAHGRRLRMTRREARMERRATEGDPLHRTQRRRLHQELLAGADLGAVRRADCVVSGGPGLAAALGYDQRTMSAPRVLVCGVGKMAANIRAEAHRRGCPVIHRRPLARALLRVEPDTELPRSLWEEAAEVLRETRDATKRPDP